MTEELEFEFVYVEDFDEEHHPITDGHKEVVRTIAAIFGATSKFGHTDKVVVSYLATVHSKTFSCRLPFWDEDKMTREILQLLVDIPSFRWYTLINNELTISLKHHLDE